MRSRDRATAKILIPGIVFLLGVPAHAAELKPKTLQAFNHYVELTEIRMGQELREGQPFLWVDRMPETRRQALYDQLRRGDVLIEHAETRQQGKPIKIPDGLVHHWVGMIFVPGVTLEETLAVLQDYDHHQDYFKPSVQRSKLLERDGNDYKVFLQLYRKTIVTAVFNADFDVRYVLVDGTRAYSRSYSTRIAEVENFGESNERERPVGRDHGYLWRLCSYWRFAQKDGGVYMQLEWIALSRPVPALLAWLINPLLSRLPRETISQTLTATRTEVKKRRPALTKYFRPSV
ncbi:MAG TPA: hypothetical protein VKE24_05470 [Candidatus Acidoferrales bacterium]|nr:hypothetical protein [Candidatus Acidoferrales bacterium]